MSMLSSVNNLCLTLMPHLRAPYKLLIESFILKISIYLLTHIEREYCDPTYAVATLHNCLCTVIFDLANPTSILIVFTPPTCARGKAIGRVVVVVSTKIANLEI